MTVAIVHYHLGPGGVSKVIASTSRLLSASGIKHVVLTGETPLPIPMHVPVRTISGLEYDGDDESPTCDVELLVNTLRAAAIEAIGCAPDVWHFHNHSLGKNHLYPLIVACLADSGECIVLQIHDLAEDGRPGNWSLISSKARLYPISNRIHYAFLNSRDQLAFIAAGLPEDHSSIIVNPIDTVGISPASTSPEAIVFSPVRGIRRKNIGELVFLSVLAPQGTRFAVSSAPLDPVALGIHDTWRRFASSERLPIQFDVVDRIAPADGLDSSFESWVAYSTHWASTSVAEGFGLPFLESIAYGKPLIGRSISHIRSEHRKHGLRTNDLYEKLLIPTDWVDLTILKDHLVTTLERNHRAYQLRLTREICDAAMDGLVFDGWLDFGNLPEPLQQGAIERVMEPGCRRVPLVEIDGITHNAREWLTAALAGRHASCTPDQLAAWSPDSALESVTRIYQTVSSSPAGPVTAIAPDDVLSEYLNPGTFHFLKSVPKPNKPLFPFRAVIFDIYGTLLVAPSGGVKPDPEFDPELRRIIRTFGHSPPASPSHALHQAVLRHHAAAGVEFPEVDLRVLWREVLLLDDGTGTQDLVEAVESAWHPTTLMPGADIAIGHLAAAGVSLGLLSNAQCNTVRSLGDLNAFFASELMLLSYQYGIAKPSPRLFEMLTDRLAGRGIAPEETLYIGNDPLHDILPAAAAGFRTALFAGHPDSFRPGECEPDFRLTHWSEITHIAH